MLGTFPLAAGFRLVKDESPSVASVPRLRALGELVGNLTFVAEAYASAPRAVGRARAHVPPRAPGPPAFPERRDLLGRHRRRPAC